MRRKQRFGVGMQRPAIDLRRPGLLDEPAEIHDRDPVADMLHDAEVVGDEEVGQAELALKPQEQVDDLRLDRHVEGRDRFVAHDQPGLERQRPRDPDPLPLSARELVRIAVVMVLAQADLAEKLDHPALAP